MNDLFKKAVQAGLGFAVITTEKAKDIVEDLLEKSKYYQKNFPMKMNLIQKRKMLMERQ